ncbi:MAG: hypothetical protein RR623_01385 [Bacilli bacterium]
MFSASQIQRAKKKLIDNGMIEVSYGKGYDRTTHYKLTDKAVEMMSDIKYKAKHQREGTYNEITERLGSKLDNPIPKKEKSLKRAYSANKDGADMHSSTVETPLASNKTMKKCFEDGFENKNAVKCPDNILEMMGRKNHVEQESTIESDSQYDDLDIEHEDIEILNLQNECVDDQLFEDVDVAILNSFQQDDKLSLSDLMKKCFDRGFTDEQEKLYSMKMNQQHFVEDY